MNQGRNECLSPPGPCCLSALSALPAAHSCFLSLCPAGVSVPGDPTSTRTLSRSLSLQPLNCGGLQSSEAASGGEKGSREAGRGKRLSRRRALLKTGIPPTAVLGPVSSPGDRAMTCTMSLVWSAAPSPLGCCPARSAWPNKSEDSGGLGVLAQREGRPSSPRQTLESSSRVLALPEIT